MGAGEGEDTGKGGVLGFLAQTTSSVPHPSPETLPGYPQSGGQQGQTWPGGNGGHIGGGALGSFPRASLTPKSFGIRL